METENCIKKYSQNEGEEEYWLIMREEEEERKEDLWRRQNLKKNKEFQSAELMTCLR